MRKITSLIILAIGWNTFVHAHTLSQELFIKPTSFVPPLDGIMYVSGTFGEPRPNHYHAGLDLRTGGVIGKNVYAADEGYLSRIRVSATGYGNALYLDHPTGLTTVYAHLHRFVPEIDEWIKELQHELESFEIDTVLTEKLFQFARGDKIALSGNTGGSAGPHLHFEIRDTYTERAINPMKYLHVVDKSAPVIGQLKVYPFEKSFYDAKAFQVQLRNTLSNTWTAETIHVPEGLVTFGIQAFDRQDYTPNNKNGIPTTKMYVDGELEFYRQMDSIDFYESKYTHAMIDYQEKVARGVDYYLTTILPNKQELRPYAVSPSDGRIRIRQGETKKIEIQLIDFHQNITKITLDILGTEKVADESSYLFKKFKEGNHSLSGATISWSENTFYDWPVLDFSTWKESKSSWSQTYDIFTQRGTAIHSDFTINISDWNAPESLENKLVLVYENLRGRKRAVATQLAGKNIQATIPEPSTVYLEVDTIAPKIQLLNYHHGSQTFGQNKILIKITDDLSGILSYHAYIDGEWALFEYDAKNNLLTHYLSDDLKGLHELRIKVEDKVHNISEQIIQFKR